MAPGVALRDFCPFGAHAIKAGKAELACDLLDARSCYADQIGDLLHFHIA